MPRSFLTASNHRQTTAVRWFMAFILIAVCLRLILTHLGIVEVATDASRVWIPLGNAITSGAAPYADIPDNKPPLFILLLGLASYVGITPALMVLTGLSNASIVWELYRWFRDERLEIGACSPPELPPSRFSN